MRFRKSRRGARSRNGMPCSMHNPGGQTGGGKNTKKWKLAYQFVNDDLPAEWLPMRRQVILSRGGRMFFARSSRSCGSCCAHECFISFHEQLYSGTASPTLTRAQAPPSQILITRSRAGIESSNGMQVQWGASPDLGKSIILGEELGIGHQVCALHHLDIVVLIMKLAIVVDARGLDENLLVHRPRAPACLGRHCAQVLPSSSDRSLLAFTSSRRPSTSMLESRHNVNVALPKLTNNLKFVSTSSCAAFIRKFE